MNDIPRHALWPRERLGDVLAVLGNRPAAAPGSPPVDPAALDGWIEHAAAALDFELLPVTITPRDFGRLVRSNGSWLVGIEGGYLGVRRFRRGRALCECPDGGCLSLPVASMTDALAEPLARTVRPDVERVISAAGIPPARQARVAQAMVAERIAGEAIGGMWLARLPAHAPMRRQFAESGLLGRLAVIAALFVLLYAAEAWGWTLIGSATLSGWIDSGWMGAWLLLLLTLLPLRTLAGWNEALFAIDGGRQVKTRLLAGAMALPVDLVRRNGIGRLVGQVMEAQVLEGLALGGGFGVLAGMIELGLAAWVLHLGIAGSWHLPLLAGFVIVAGFWALGFHRAIAGWSQRRLAMTHYLIDAMVGHRTRLAQESPRRRDLAEDAQLTDYLSGSAGMDRATVRLGNMLALAWTASAVVAMALALGSRPAPFAIAISFGGILLASRALASVGQGLSSLSQAGFAWSRVAEMFRAGSQGCPPNLAPALPTAPLQGAAVSARGLHYAYDGGRAVLAGADLDLAPGDRVLVEGPSGGGKSTLAALLTGERQADSGLLLLDGLDPATLGSDWRRRVTSAPQFHENHVFSGTLAFNLLMGRQWPPSPQDLAEAEALCRELGLGELLDRMPGGLQQRVGETGWQLSHGERSRIFLARALLQSADVTILDESFGALDPQTMDQCLAATLARTRTLMVIAHP